MHKVNKEITWKLHIQCLLQMTPWFTAYDQINYASYLPAYILTMLKTSTSHPDAHSQLILG